MAVYRPSYKDSKTGETKHSRVWWFHFNFAGRHIQESSKSTRKTVAVEAEKRRRLELERAHAGLPVEEPARRIRTIAQTLKEYGEAYKTAHRPSSILMVKHRAAHLLKHLGSLLLPDATAERIVQYMQTRKAEDAGGRTINLEIEILASAIGFTWRTLWPRVKRLEENHDVGRALDPAEEAKILDLARANQSKLIYPYLQVLIWTGLRSSEARTLRWGRILIDGEIIVGDSKTRAGKGRVIPVSPALRAVLEEHAAWIARRLGPIQPEWCVFPLSNRLAPVDPLRPATSLKTAWFSIKADSGVTCRLHDLRHSFATRMAELGVPEAVALDMMGHVSPAMLRRYTHVRAQARRDAIAAMQKRFDSIGVAKESAKVADSEAEKTAVTH